MNQIQGGEPPRYIARSTGVETKEVLRQCVGAVGCKCITTRVELDVKTVRCYVHAVQALGLTRASGDAALTHGYSLLCWHRCVHGYTSAISQNVEMSSKLSAANPYLRNPAIRESTVIRSEVTSLLLSWNRRDRRVSIAHDEKKSAAVIDRRRNWVMPRGHVPGPERAERPRASSTENPEMSFGASVDRVEEAPGEVDRDRRGHGPSRRRASPCQCSSLEPRRSNRKRLDRSRHVGSPPSPHFFRAAVTFARQMVSAATMANRASGVIQS